MGKEIDPREAAQAVLRLDVVTAADCTRRWARSGVDPAELAALIGVEVFAVRASPLIGRATYARIGGVDHIWVRDGSRKHIRTTLARMLGHVVRARLRARTADPVQWSSRFGVSLLGARVRGAARRT